MRFKVGDKYVIGAKSYYDAVRVIKILDAAPDADVDLDFLIKDELKAIDGYRTMIAKTSNPRLLSVLSHILDEETEHVEELRAAKSGVYKVDADDSIGDRRDAARVARIVDRTKQSNVKDASINYASAKSDDDYLNDIEKLLRQKANVYVDAFIDTARGGFHVAKNYRQKRNLSRDDLNKIIDVLRSSTDLKDLRSEHPDGFDAAVRGTIPGYGA